MNDQGLFYDLAALTSRNDIDFPSNLKSSGGFLCMKMLEECATLEEAIALYRSYKDRLLRSGHIMIVDRSGNSAIIEWGRDELSVVEKKDYFQVMTNFNTTVPNIFFAYPCYRYNHLTMTFKRDDEISIDRFCALLDDVDSDGTRWAHTVYSTVFDLQEKRIYLYYLRNYGDVFVIDLDDELRKGAHHYDLKSALSAGVNVRPQ